MAVLDTSFLVDLLRGHPPALAILDQLEENGVPQVAPAPVIFELAVELGRKRTSHRRARRLKAALQGLHVQVLDEEAALIAGKIVGRLEDQGTPIDDIDCMIAAIALKIGQPLVTGNKKHFARIKDLKLLSY